MFQHIQRKHFIFALVVFLLVGCSNLPDNAEKQVSQVMSNTDTTYLSKLVEKQTKDQAGKTGAILLANGLDAFVARVALAEKAERSIDVQYYMFHQDTVGQLLIHRLIKAADRGVRVRVLIDDMYGEEADNVWTTLDSHPHMEVRLFNPFVRGSSKNLQFITRLSDVNYRMHSKSFTVDNRLTIIGGRNIGDEYFDANKDLAFADMDMLAIGPVVPEVSDAFDQYWNSDHAYPASTLAGQALIDTLPTLKKRLAEFENNAAATSYITALLNSELANGLLRNGTIHFSWGEAQLMHDSSEKKERGKNWKEDLLISKLWPYLESLNEELLIISPYFVPGQKGADALCRLSAKGVRIRILTNSLASNDVSAVHAGYSRYRKQLIKAGVELYELDEEINKEVMKRLSWLPGLSKSSLHAKTMVLDQDAMFVGSMNLDQRSLNINNEIGILFFNKELAGKSARVFIDNIDKVAFRVTLDGSGSLQWKVNRDGKEIVFENEPYAGFWAKLSVWFLRLLPVESFL
ncbi:phospholipase D family protein [Desulfosediminicola flagellatus]|uniref:phospholipase D family protein n=1 Tax=Desulfosediminicola flagellatus TaxID=2569541 RepID=UPI0010AC6E1C|nr:phospholipase D family protein [Desulfosediminicola flagellatus]